MTLPPYGWTQLPQPLPSVGLVVAPESSSHPARSVDPLLFLLPEPCLLSYIGPEILLLLAALFACVWRLGLFLLLLPRCSLSLLAGLLFWFCSFRFTPLELLLWPGQVRLLRVLYAPLEQARGPLRFCRMLFLLAGV